MGNLTLIIVCSFFQDADEFIQRQEYLFEKLKVDSIVFKAPNMESGETQEDNLVKGYHFYYIFGFDLNSEGYVVLKKGEKGITRTLYSDEMPSILITKMQGFKKKKLKDYKSIEEKLGNDAVYWEHGSSSEKNKSSEQSARLNRLITAMRTIKSPAEIALIQKATDITCNAHNQVMKKVSKLKTEQEIEKLILNTYAAEGAQDIGFSCIVGSGVNGVTLHYMDNNSNLPDDSLVVIDIGCKYNNYVTDVTRTIPTGGKFSGKMKKAYEAVLGAQKEAEKRLKPGVTLAQLQEVSVRYLKEQNFPPFPHGLSHHVGLAVHDDNNTGYMKPLKAGMVITIEPGYYSKKDGFGIRIEDMYLVTESGFIRMSESAPREIDQIEKLITTPDSVVAANEPRKFDIDDKELDAQPSSKRRTFGINVDTSVTDEDIDSLKLEQNAGAVKVESVVPGSVADKCGIEDGDYIINFDGKDIGRDSSYEDLVSLIQTAKAGTEIKIVVIRNGKSMTLNAKFEK
ncbi:MAG: M24 family metallopeptidase [Planctomycetes bacterium]|nr:M24 family metallopeptidase [Planctomycetota bacterium]